MAIRMEKSRGTGGVLCKRCWCYMSGITARSAGSTGHGPRGVSVCNCVSRPTVLAAAIHQRLQVLQWRQMHDGVCWPSESIARPPPKMVDYKRGPGYHKACR